MEDKSGGIEAALRVLQSAIDKFLEHQANKYRPATENVLWSSGEKEPPKCPAAYDAYLDLKTFGGRNGEIPMLWAGGALNQPWLMMKTLKACQDAERDFSYRMSLAIQK